MNSLIVDSGPLIDRIALIEDGKLQDLFIEEKSEKRIMGNIYKGRVVNVLPGMQAAFIDIGLKKNGYLYIKDAIPFDEKKAGFKDKRIKDYVKSGQEIFVQVLKPEVEDKGPKLTTNLSISGRYTVLTPMDSFVGISKKITNVEKRKKLKTIVKNKIPKGMGCVVRTEAGKVDLELVLKDLSYVLHLWKRIEREKHLGKTPRIVNRELALPFRVLRDSKVKEWEHIKVNEKELFENLGLYIKYFMPGKEGTLSLSNHGPLLFENEGVERQIKDLLTPEVKLDHGGSIVIEETTALTSIDVNSGKFIGEGNVEDTFLKTNLKASDEIMRQLRLRNISGIIVVDFIDMIKKEHKQKVVDRMTELSKQDSVQVDLYGFTKLGLMEMSRKKIDNSVLSRLYKECPVCEGVGRVSSELQVANQVLKEIERIVTHTSSEAAVIEIDPKTHQYLEESSMIRTTDLFNIYKLTVTFNVKKDSDQCFYKLKFMGRESDVGKFTKQY